MPRPFGETVWVKLDLTHGAAASIEATLRTAARAEIPENEPSVNVNAAGTAAWAKAPAGAVVPPTPAVVRVDDDNAAALADMNAPGWYPSE